MGRMLFRWRTAVGHGPRLTVDQVVNAIEESHPKLVCLPILTVPPVPCSRQLNCAALLKRRDDRGAHPIDGHIIRSTRVCPAVGG